MRRVFHLPTTVGRPAKPVLLGILLALALGGGAGVWGFASLYQEPPTEEKHCITLRIFGELRRNCAPPGFRWWEPAGTWEHLVAEVPDARIRSMAGTDHGIVLHKSGLADELLFWREGSDSIESLGLVRDLIGYGARGDEVILVSREFEGPGAIGALLVERYNLATGDLSVDPIRIDDDRHRYTVVLNAASRTVGNKLYLFGGCCLPSVPAIWSYNLDTYEVRHVANIPPEHGPDDNGYRVHLTTGWDGESLYTGLGSHFGSHSNADTRGIYAYHLERKEWRRVMELSKERGAHSLLLHEGHFWLFAVQCVAHASPPQRPVFRGDFGVYLHGGEYVSISSVLEWKGRHYIYARGTIHINDSTGWGQLTGGLFLWTPPDPAEWPHPQRIAWKEQYSSCL